jgi:hypothetical protein
MQPGTRTTSSRRASSPMGQVAAPRVPHLDRQLWPVPGGCARSSVHLICCFFAMRWLTGLAQRTHRTARFPLLARAAARPQPRARHLDLAKHSPRHDRSVVLVRQHRAAAATGHLARHPACGLLRHQNRLNLSQQSAASASVSPKSATLRSCRSTTSTIVASAAVAPVCAPSRRASIISRMATPNGWQGSPA